MDTIQPKSMTFGQLFQQRLFVIPEYQRAYSWQAKHRQALFADIQRVIQSGSSARSGHFMATIVGLRRGKKAIGIDDYEQIEVVDGQQRITTLIILLKAISLNLIDTAIKRDINDLLVKRDKTSVLLSNHDTQGYFRDYIRSGVHPIPDVATRWSDRQMLLSMHECETFVKASGIAPAKLASILKNALSCVFYELTDQAVVYTVFEVLNSRGLAVSWFDRLKSMLMAKVFHADVYKSNGQARQDVIREVHELWSQIYDTIGLSAGLSTESLRFAATLWAPEIRSRPMSEEDSAEFLAAQSEGPAGVVKTTKWLLRMTRAVEALHANPRLNAVTGIAHARLVAVAINLRSDLSRDERKHLLQRWENVTFRVFGMYRRDARTGVGDYVRLSWQIAREQLSKDEILTGLSSIGWEFPVDQAIEELRAKNCYHGWEEELRYFMQRREEHLAASNKQKFKSEQWQRIWQDSAYRSIEHIMPQSTEGVDVHHLGNLVVLPPGLNSTLQDLDPKDKASAYIASGLLVAGEVAHRINANPSPNNESTTGWQSRDTEERENRLLEWASEVWAD